MEVYIVIGKTEAYHPNYPSGTFNSYENEVLALSTAIDMARGDVSIGGTDQLFKLKKIIKLNTNNLKATELELTLIDGSFKLDAIN